MSASASHRRRLLVRSALLETVISSRRLSYLTSCSLEMRKISLLGYITQSITVKAVQRARILKSL